MRSQLKWPKIVLLYVLEYFQGDLGLLSVVKSLVHAMHC